MLDNFLKRWKITAMESYDSRQRGLPLRGNPTAAYYSLSDLVREYAGATFADGLYRIHGVESAQKMRQECVRLVPNAGRVTFPFAFDWLGRQLAVDLRDPDDLPVIQFDPAAGVAYE